jgi:hypothetical protein
MGTVCSDYYYKYEDHFHSISKYILLDQRFIRVKHNSYPLSVICNYNITDVDTSISECKKCHRFIGHESCIQSKQEICPNCFHIEN